MRIRRFASQLASALPLVILACGSSAQPAAVDAGDPGAFASQPTSCGYQCPLKVDCAEVTTPYQCPSLASWKAIPHDTTCPAWDGTYPTPAATKCSVSAPAGDAIKYAGPDPSDRAAYLLPDGRRVRAAGAEWLFDEAALIPGFTSKLVAIPGTSLALTVDTGDGPHSVRLVDTSKIGSGASPVLGFVAFNPPETLNSSIVFIAPDLALVATDDGVVQALTVDTTRGTIARADARSFTLPPSVNDQGKPAHYYVSALALSPDAKRLLVASPFDHNALLFDTATGKQLGSVDVGAATFDCGFDPFDPASAHVYCTRWDQQSLVGIDLTDPARPKLAQTYPADKVPEGLAFLDARWMVVANDLGDKISVVDRVGGTVTPLPADASTPLHGAEPTRLAYDKSAKRLYATLTGINAIAAWNVDLQATPPSLTPAGMLPTSWWPADVAVLADGSLLVANARGQSNGPLLLQTRVGHGETTNGVRGGIQKIPTPSAADLTAGEQAVRSNNNAGARAGSPKVTCPNGENDFPVPGTNTEGPSKQIKRIVFIVRENKTFDSVLGDMPGVNGDPSLTLKKSSADMDKLWKNYRNLVRTFATSDNYYTDAELSAQGHVWTLYGRSGEFTERTWMIDGYARSVYTSPLPLEGFTEISRPVEGSVLDWLGRAGVVCDSLGEGLALNSVIGNHNPVDKSYPGGFVQRIEYPDIERACYFAGRERVLCDLGQFVYQTLPNDHTLGVTPTQPSPETMVAMNDEATGMEMDAIAHSPFWKETLIIVTEDDPADGGDHVEHHRTPILFVSPWIKRGYVSKTHIDVSSLHKLFAHVYGVPYPNQIVANAALPFDLFSQTPDYTPYVYAPREWPLTCGVEPSLAEKSLAASWDLSRVDEQPGLDAQVWRYMRGEQVTELTPALKAQLDAAGRKRPSRRAPRDDD